tara:strand:+ start:439 stop:2055 length:1617 start_codon:yes stop_codon:yes gene_type:complete
MAVIKINRSSARIAPIETPRVSALSMDQNIMLNYGTSIAQVGKVINDAQAKTQKTQDMNDVRDLMKTAQMTIIGEANKYRNSSNVGDVQTFYNAVHYDKFKELLKPYNKEVVKLFTTELYKASNDTGMKLFASVLKEHGQVTQDNITKDIFKLNIDESSNDVLKRKKAQIEKNRIFNDPSTLAIFGAKELDALKQSSIIETLTMQFSNRIKNKPMDILELGEKNIIDQVGNETLAKKIIRDATNSLISQSLADDKINELTIKFNSKQKITNFSYVIQQLNSGDTTISLDDVNDLYKKTALNSSQRDALYELITNPRKLSDQNTIDYIEGALLVADSVEDIDELQRQILSNPEYVYGLGLTEFSKYNNLFDKYKEDQPAYTEYQNNKKLLEADLGKVSSGKLNIVSQVLNSGAAIKKDEKLRIVATDYYDKLVLNGETPADAYLKTTERFLRGNTIPPIKNFTSLSSIELKEPTELEAKDTTLYIENRTKDLVALYKDGSISITTFSSDLASIDSIQELINLRVSLNVDPFGFKKKTEE